MWKFNIPSIICILAAIVFIYLEKDGWGWMLFVGLMIFVSPDENRK